MRLNPCPGVQSCFLIFKLIEQKYSTETRPARPGDRKPVSLCGCCPSTLSEADFDPERPECLLSRNKRFVCWSIEQRQKLCVSLYFIKRCFHIRRSPAYALPRMYMKISIDRPRTIFFTRILNVLYCIDL